MTRSLLVLAVLVITGCTSSKSLYYWGSYEPILLDMYTAPGEADTLTQIEKLTNTIQRAQSQGMQVPPGLYAHLGMVYAQAGNPGLAIEAFNEEKNRYPESAHFIDGMLERAKSGAQR